MVLGLFIVAVLVSLCLLKALIWVWWEPKKLERQLREQGIKGPPYRLLYGNLKENLTVLLEAQSKPMKLSHSIVPRVIPYLHRTVQKYGKLSIFWYGVTPNLNIMDPELIKSILSNKYDQQCSKIRLNPLGKLLVTGIVSYTGQKWAKHKRIINPAFHIDKLKIMFPAFCICCNELITKWEKLVSEGPFELDVFPEFQKLTGDAISRTAFGSNYEEGQRIFQLQIELTELVSQVVRSIYIPGFRFLPTKRNKRMKEIAREVRTLLKDIIEKREKAMKLGQAQTNDLLGLLLDSNFREIQEHGNSNNVGMSIDDVIEECKLFYFAGQDTTSSLLVWTMVVLSMHQEWQEAAREEVFQVFGRTEPPNIDGLNQLKIVTMILYEVLRLYPPFVSLFRRTYKKMKLGEIEIPQGVQIGLRILLVHHDRDIWGDDVEEFKPERFSEGVLKATKNQVSFFPFSWGPRVCIGQNFAMMEAKIALAMILQHFSFNLSPSYVHAPNMVITLQPQHGAQIVLHKI